MKRTIHIFLTFYALCLLVQIIGGYFTQLSVTTWYQTLEKSALTPPGYVFGIVWTALYILMAIAATRIYLKRNTWRSRTLTWWLAQLILGLIWTIVFFGHREVVAGLVVLFINWAAVALVTYRAYRIDRSSGWLLLPLLGWVSFACYLNGFIAHKL